MTSADDEAGVGTFARPGRTMVTQTLDGTGDARTIATRGRAAATGRPAAATGRPAAATGRPAAANRLLLDLGWVHHPHYAGWRSPTRRSACCWPRSTPRSC